ncbi:Co2+/Mg2+ efflux protein ApaG [Polaribacter sp. AHE13PA]|uniref:Co2+/Mg2+ efflux protein ApaG n=1 Tax=Polaribacter sp. AHE13PA TaxID=2745562 RepID=UPI001C4F3D95|nr:Co2+/Mg2+ efflux protein ApaG [Polaribacter sp. AHE13PA]QXP66754.1 Co2+/Mg2+ efflux protein ApaG [Polaribacter sp. AHE13PA]
MINQITKGIKISVDTKYKGTNYRNNRLHHIFGYIITIENKSTETVKLTDRFWTIFDTLNNTEIVSGEGVVGQTPILKPNDIYKYGSGCFLESNIGAMKGFYTMINLETFEQFKVIIPTFQLTTQSILN